MLKNRAFRGLLPLIVIFFILFASDNSRCEETVLFETKLNLSIEAILLPVTVKGVSYTFLFDTGSTLTVFDKSIEHLLGEPLDINHKATTPSGQVPFSYYKPVDIKLGQLTLKSKQPYLSADLTFAGKALGQVFQGIIAMDLIHQYIWKFNYGEGKIQILSTNTNQNTDEYETVIPIHPIQRMLPAIYIDLVGNSIPFVIDTADTGSGELTKDLLDSMIDKKLVHDIASDTSVSVTGQYSTRRVRINDFKIGPFVYDNLLMSEAQQNAIGLSLLKRHDFILDLPNIRLFLRKGPNFSFIEHEDKSGIKIINDNGQVVIGFIDERGPAADVGLLAGDKIISVNRKPVSGNDLKLIRDKLKGKDGEKLFIKINRDGEIINANLILKKGYNYL